MPSNVRSHPRRFVFWRVWPRFPRTASMSLHSTHHRLFMSIFNSLYSNDDDWSVRSTTLGTFFERRATDAHQQQNLSLKRPRVESVRDDHHGNVDPFRTPLPVTRAFLAPAWR